MPIQIAKNLKDKLPPAEKAQDVEKKLLDKSGGFCFLCGGGLVEATDTIYADHDLPEKEGGKTELSNLNLVHSDCNSFKRNHPTVDVRPYLKLLNLIKSEGGFVKYGQAAKLLGLSPKSVDIDDTGESITITTASKKIKAPVFSETNKEGTFRYTYFEISRDFIFNDEECQPRNIKPQHLWQIYNDISRNPLHEAPACRLVKTSETIKTNKILMFDGQHKTLAHWIASRDNIVIKLYLNLTKEQAIRLVNSVQSKIKKLPLSPFELARKMSEEMQERVRKYESSVGTENASEEGFLKWVEKDERSRAKSAFEDALVEDILSDENLILTKNFIKLSNDGIGANVSEATMRNKLLKPLLHMAPLSEKFPAATKAREIEHSVIVKLLNILASKAFKADGMETEADKVRIKRMQYQASLLYVTTMMRRIVGHFLAVASPKELLEKEPTPEQWAKIEHAIERIVRHPIWTIKDLNRTEKTTAVRNALEKNQDANNAFGNVHMKLGDFVIDSEKVPDDWDE